MKKTLIILCILLMLAGCGRNSSEDAPELLEPVGVSIDTCTAEIGDIVNRNVQYGRMIPGTTKLYFKTDGTVKSVPVYSGKYVEEGEVLITLDVDDVIEQDEALKEQLESMEEQWEFELQLYNLDINYVMVELNEIAARQGTGSAAYAAKSVELQQANQKKEHAVEDHEAEVESLETVKAALDKKIEQKELCAPHSGYVYFDDSLSEGSPVHDGGTVMYLMDPSDARFITEGYVSEYDYERVPMFAYINGKEYEVELIIPEEDELRAAQLAGESLQSEFYIKDGKDLVCGDMGALYIEYLHVKDVLILPKNAILNDDGGKYIYVINDDGTRTKRYIETGRTNNAFTEIRSELTEGETVYVPD